MYLRYVKRICDVLMAGVGLILSSPLLVIIACFVKAGSKGPVLYRQRRRGLHGRVFVMLKFRTMIEHAEEMGTGLFNYEGDFRVTKVGRLLRKSSLDELPQLINILKGDMSIVGPRPSVEDELGEFETLNATYRKRFETLPGITGLAQVSGRNEIPWSEKVLYDNAYIDRIKTEGIKLDLYIIWKTVLHVFSMKEIYEEKIDETVSDKEAALYAEAEVIKQAHKIEKEG